MTRDSSTTVVRRIGERPALIAALALLLAILAGIAGYEFATGGKPQRQFDQTGRRVAYWYDPMVPQEHYPGPGKSSMGMALQPKYADEGAQGGVAVSPAMMQNLGIRLAKVEVRDLSAGVRSVGHVDFDQRLITQVQTGPMRVEVQRTPMETRPGGTRTTSRGHHDGAVGLDGWCLPGTHSVSPNATTTDRPASRNAASPSTATQPPLSRSGRCRLPPLRKRT